MYMTLSPNLATGALDNLPTSRTHGVLPSRFTWYQLGRHAARHRSDVKGWSSGTPPCRFGCVQRTPCCPRRSPFAVCAHPPASSFDFVLYSGGSSRALWGASYLLHLPSQCPHARLVVAFEDGSAVAHVLGHKPHQRTPILEQFRHNTCAGCKYEAEAHGHRWYSFSFLVLGAPVMRAPCVSCHATRTPCALGHVREHVLLVLGLGRRRKIAIWRRGTCFLGLLLWSASSTGHNSSCTSPGAPEFTSSPAWPLAPGTVYPPLRGWPSPSFLFGLMAIDAC